MKNQIFTLLFVFIILLFSCNNKSNTEEIRKIDSLTNEMASIEQALSDIDSSAVFGAWENYNNYWNEFNTVFSDERDEYWNTITQYGSVKKGLKEFVKQYSDISKEYNYSKEQLEALKSEVRNNNITKEEFEKYFNDEAKAVSSLKQLVPIIVDMAEKDLKKYDSLTPIMMDILEHYREKSSE